MKFTGSAEFEWHVGELSGVLFFGDLGIGGVDLVESSGKWQWHVNALAVSTSGAVPPIMGLVDTQYDAKEAVLARLGICAREEFSDE